MSKLTRTLALLATLAMASTAFVACGGNNNTESTASPAANDASVADDANAGGDESVADGGEETPAAAGTGEVTLPSDDATLSVVAWNDNDLGPMIKLYNEKNPDADVQYVNCGSNGDEANEQYSTFLNSADDVDLFVAEAGWILNYIAGSDYAAPLTELGIDKGDFANAYQYTVDIATDNSGVLKGASWQAAAGGWVYNADIASEQLGIDNEADMQTAVKDWDAFEETAAKLKEATGGSVTMTATLGGLWQAYSTGSGATWVNDGVINTDAAKPFAEMAIRFVSEGYVDPTISQWDTPWYNAGQNGETLGYFFSTWCFPSGGTMDQCVGTAGNWRLIEGPVNFFWGGSWLVPSVNCNSGELAADFVRFFTVDTDTMQEYAETSGDFVNNKVAMSNIVAAGTNSNSSLGGQDQFDVLIDIADGITMSDTITRYDQSLKNAFNDTLQADINTDADTVIADFLTKALTENPNLSAE